MRDLSAKTNELTVLVAETGSNEAQVQLTFVMRLQFFPGNGSDSEISDSGAVFPIILNVENNNAFPAHPKTLNQVP